MNCMVGKCSPGPEETAAGSWSPWLDIAAEVSDPGARAQGGIISQRGRGRNAGRPQAVAGTSRVACIGHRTEREREASEGLRWYKAQKRPITC